MILHLSDFILVSSQRNSALKLLISQTVANLAIKLIPDFPKLARSLASLCIIDPSLPRQRHLYRWLWVARNPRRRAWTAWVEGTRSPSGHAAASSPASAAPKGPHPWGTPRASPASASARYVALSGCCNSSPTLPARDKMQYTRNDPIIIVSNPHDINIFLLFLSSRELDVMRSITFYLVHNKTTTSAGHMRLSHSWRDYYAFRDQVCIHRRETLRCQYYIFFVRVIAIEDKTYKNFQIF